MGITFVQSVGSTFEETTTLNVVTVIATTMSTIIIFIFLTSSIIIHISTCSFESGKSSKKINLILIFNIIKIL